MVRVRMTPRRYLVPLPESRVKHPRSPKSQESPGTIEEYSSSNLYVPIVEGYPSAVRVTHAVDHEGRPSLIVGLPPVAVDSSSAFYAKNKAKSARHAKLEIERKRKASKEPHGNGRKRTKISTYEAIRLTRERKRKAPGLGEAKPCFDEQVSCFIVKPPIVQEETSAGTKEMPNSVKEKSTLFKEIPTSTCVREMASFAEDPELIMKVPDFDEEAATVEKELATTDKELPTNLAMESEVEIETTVVMTEDESENNAESLNSDDPIPIARCIMIYDNFLKFRKDWDSDDLYKYVLYNETMKAVTNPSIHFKEEDKDLELSDSIKYGHKSFVDGYETDNDCDESDSDSESAEEGSDKSDSEYESAEEGSDKSGNDSEAVEESFDKSGNSESVEVGSEKSGNYESVEVGSDKSGNDSESVEEGSDKSGYNSESVEVGSDKSDNDSESVEVGSDKSCSDSY